MRERAPRMVPSRSEGSMDLAADVGRREDGKSRWLGALRVLAILVPLGFLVGRVDADDLPDALATVGLRGFVAASLLQIGACFVSAIRWRLLLELFGASRAAIPGLLALTRLYFIGLYFQMIPSGLVGEIVRAQRTTPLFEAPLTSYVVILVDRVCASFGLLSLGLVSAFAFDLGIGEASLLGTVRGALLVAWAACVLVIAVPFGLGTRSLRSRLAGTKRLGPLLAHSIGEPNPTAVLVALALSIGVEVLTSLAITATILPAARPGDGLGPVLVAPVILLLTFLPITPGALGQRELAFVTLLEPRGVAGADATAAAIVTLAVTVVMAILGFVALALDRRELDGAPPRDRPAPLP